MKMQVKAPRGRDCRSHVAKVTFEATAEMDQVLLAAIYMTYTGQTIDRNQYKILSSFCKTAKSLLDVKSQ